jgi:hypothetical protein
MLHQKGVKVINSQNVLFYSEKIREDRKINIEWKKAVDA